MAKSEFVPGQKVQGMPAIKVTFSKKIAAGNKNCLTNPVSIW